MKFDNLVSIYLDLKKKFGDKAYMHLSELFNEIKKNHKKDFQKQDHEQSWRAFKGKNLQKLLEFIIKNEIADWGLAVVSGEKLEKSSDKKLGTELAKVKRNLYVDYGEFGAHLPDADLIIYYPKTCEVLAILSIKVTLRERIAQTGYWKLKLLQSPITKNIKVFFLTVDEDKTLVHKIPTKKGRAIVEVDTDGSYILNDFKIDESKKVKMFDKFFVDLLKSIDKTKI